MRENKSQWEQLCTDWSKLHKVHRQKLSWIWHTLTDGQFRKQISLCAKPFNSKSMLECLNRVALNQRRKTWRLSASSLTSTFEVNSHRSRVYLVRPPSVLKLPLHFKDSGQVSENRNKTTLSAQRATWPFWTEIWIKVRQRNGASGNPSLIPNSISFTDRVPLSLLCTFLYNLQHTVL